MGALSGNRINIIVKVDLLCCYYVIITDNFRTSTQITVKVTGIDNKEQQRRFDYNKLLLK